MTHLILADGIFKRKDIIMVSMTMGQESTAKFVNNIDEYNYIAKCIDVRSRVLKIIPSENVVMVILVMTLGWAQNNV
jgi:hypothetical protein